MKTHLFNGFNSEDRFLPLHRIYLEFGIVLQINAGWDSLVPVGSGLLASIALLDAIVSKQPKLPQWQRSPNGSIWI